MFRRIELIHPASVDADGDSYPGWKQGLTPASSSEVGDAWIDDLLGPSRSSLPPNCRFYFTEKGWREVGRKGLWLRRVGRVSNTASSRSRKPTPRWSGGTRSEAMRWPCSLPASVERLDRLPPPPSDIRQQRASDVSA